LVARAARHGTAQLSCGRVSNQLFVARARGARAARVISVG